MRYQGGKSRIAGQIAAKIRELHPTATEIWDVCCGGGATALAFAETQALMREEIEPFADITEAEYTMQGGTSART